MNGQLITGAAFFLVGGAYLADEFGWWNIDGRYFFPILVILIGLAILIGQPNFNRSEE